MEEQTNLKAYLSHNKKQHLDFAGNSTAQQFLRDHPEVDEVTVSYDFVMTLKTSPEFSKRYWEYELRHDADACSEFVSNMDIEICFTTRDFPATNFTTDNPLPMIAIQYNRVVVRFYIPDDDKPETIRLFYKKHFFQDKHRISLCNKPLVDAYGTVYNFGILVTK